MNIDVIGKLAEEIVRGLVTLTEKKLTLIRDLLQELNGDNAEKFAEELGKFIRMEPCWERKVNSSITHSFKVFVDEITPIETLLRECDLSWGNENITSKNFPTVEGGKKEKREVVIFNFKKDMSSEAVVFEMDKAGYRAGTIRELLALALKEPDLQKDFPIVALGSSAKIDASRPLGCLSSDGGNRCLCLESLGGIWAVGYRFLAVRK